MKILTITSVLFTSCMLISCSWDKANTSHPVQELSHASSWTMVTNMSTGNMMAPQSSSGSR